MFVCTEIHDCLIGLQFLPRNYRVNEQKNGGDEDYPTIMQSSIDFFYLQHLFRLIGKNEMNYKK